MNNTIPSTAPAALHMLVASEPPIFSVPARHNPRLQAVAERINGDEELRQYWRCANVNSVERLGLGDSGEVHVRIVANAALKLLRLLRDAGQAPAVVSHHRLAPDDAEVIVVLAAAVHDLGLAVHTAPGLAARAGLMLAERKCQELLAGIYPTRERVVVEVEVLHAVASQETGVECLTLEGNILKLADALDLTKGRARLPNDGSRRSGMPNSVPVVDEVSIHRAKSPAVQVIVRLSQPDGLPAVEALLQEKLRRVPLAGMVEVLARVEGLPSLRLVPLHVWNAELD